MFLSTPSRIPVRNNGPTAPFAVSGIDAVAGVPGGLQQLWASVLFQAWQDSVAPIPWERPAGGRALMRDQADAWFGTADFFAVCALAGLDGAAVLERWRQARRAASEAAA